MIARTLGRVRTAARESTIPHDAGMRRVGTRLAFQTVGLVLVMLIVLEVVVYIITQQALIGSLKTTLRERSTPDAGFVRAIYHLGAPPLGQPGFGGNPGGDGGPRFGPGGPHEGNPDLLPSDASSAFVNTHQTIVHPDGILGHIILDRNSLQTALNTGRTQCCSVKQYKGEDYLVYSNPLFGQGRLVGAVQSSISEHQYENTVNLLLQSLIVVALLGLLGAGGVSLVLVQRALMPIRAAVQRQRDFVADAAHELRTPLAIQRTVGEVGMVDAMPEEYESTIEQMLVENKHLTRLVDDLSLLARADSNAVSISPSRMNLTSLVRDTASELEPLAEERGIHLTIDVEPNIVVQGDVMRLRQLLLVLLDNALKFASRGAGGETTGGTVEVRLHASGGRVVLQVQDAGPGIDPTDLPHIFNRFYRADKARTGEGSGLGLAIAKWIVEAHGGQIRAANGTPGGAILTATLPTARTSA